jgi:hypothetical protein
VYAGKEEDESNCDYEYPHQKLGKAVRGYGDYGDLDDEDHHHYRRDRLDDFDRGIPEGSLYADSESDTLSVVYHSLGNPLI